MLSRKTLFTQNKQNGGGYFYYEVKYLSMAQLQF